MQLKQRLLKQSHSIYWGRRYWGNSVTLTHFHYCGPVRAPGL